MWRKGESAPFREEREAKAGWVGGAKWQVRAIDVVTSDEGRRFIPLRGRGSDRARALPHSTAMNAITKKSLCGLEVHQAGWDGSGAGGRILEDRYGACSSIRCRG